MARMGAITVLRKPETGLEATAPTMADDPWRHAPLDSALAGAVRQLVDRLGPAQRLWLSGYLAGSLAPVSVPVAGTGASPATAPVTILFGSESGNSQRLAQQLARR